MSLIIEDGTGKPDAEAYRSVADHKTYCIARGIAFSTDDTVLEQQARKATDYIGQAYRTKWAGFRKTAEQALDWPRYEVAKRDAPGGFQQYAAFYPSDTVPVEVGNAQSELMTRIATLGDLAPDLQRGIKREKVGQLETEYDTNSSQSPRFPAVDNLLSPLFKAGGSNVGLVRA
jgi:hypothetical protein